MFAGPRLSPRSPIWDWLGVLELLSTAALIIGFIVLTVRQPSNRRRLTRFVDERNALRNAPQTENLDPTAQPSRREADGANVGSGSGAGIEPDAETGRSEAGPSSGRSQRRLEVASCRVEWG